eukprot:ctg_4482.g628
MDASAPQRSSDVRQSRGAAPVHPMDTSRFRAAIRTLRQWARYAGPGWLFCVCLLDPG